MERTFIMLKPDAVQRGLVGEVINRFENKGFKLVAMKLIQVSRTLAEEHYAEHRGKGFFEPTVGYIMSSPVVAMVWQGKNGVALARESWIVWDGYQQKCYSRLGLRYECGT